MCPFWYCRIGLRRPQFMLKTPAHLRVWTYSIYFYLFRSSLSIVVTTRFWPHHWREKRRLGWDAEGERRERISPAHRQWPVAQSVVHDQLPEHYRQGYCTWCDAEKSSRFQTIWRESQRIPTKCCVLSSIAVEFGKTDKDLCRVGSA